VDQGTRDQDAPGLSGGHFCNRTLGQVRYLELRQSSLSQFEMLRVDHMMRENARATEESRQDDIASAYIAGTSGQQIVLDDAQHGTQFEDVPAVLPQDGHR